MKQFVEEQGDVILQTVIIMAILVLLFSNNNAAGENGQRGVLARLSQDVKVSEGVICETGELSLEKLEVLETVAQTGKPLIEVSCRKLLTDTDYPVDTCIRAMDAEGKETLDILVTHVQRKSDGEDVTSLVYDENGKILRFSKQGEYCITVWAMDGNRKSTKVKINFAVNGDEI